MTSQSRARARLLLLAALFLAPFVGAVTLYYGFPEHVPSGRQNYGTLVDPVRPVPDLALTDAGGAAAPAAVRGGKWSLVYLGGATCNASCSERVLLTRQVRLALAKNRERVQRVYLAPDATAAAQARAQFGAEHHDLVVLVTSGSAAAQFFQPADRDAIYLLDPLGNWVMTYAGAIEHKGLYRDIKKLLRVSRAG